MLLLAFHVGVVVIDGDMTRKTVVVIGFVLVDNNEDNGGNNEGSNDAGSVYVLCIVMIMRLYTQIIFTICGYV